MIEMGRYDNSTFSPKDLNITAICNPIFYKLLCRTRYVVIFITVSWLFNLLFMCSAFLVEDIVDKENNSLIIWLFLDEHYLLCISINLVLNLLIPLLIVIHCYARIDMYVRRHPNLEVFTQSRTETYIQQAKGIILISMTYLLTQLPIYVAETLKKPLGESDGDYKLVIINATLVALVYLYIVIKMPLILYGFNSYRRVFLRNMCCSKTRQTRTNRALEGHPGRVYSVSDQPTRDQSSSQSEF